MEVSIPSSFFCLLAAILILTGRAAACDAGTYLRLMAEAEKARKARPAELNRKDILLLHSDNLALLAREAARLFELEHKGYKVYLESTGMDSTPPSRASTGGADIILLADSWPIRNVMMPTGLADWYVVLGRDRVVLAYGGEGRNSEALASGSWRDLLGSPTLRSGTTSPESDVSGFHAALALQLVRGCKGLEPFRPSKVFHSSSELVKAVIDDEIDYAITLKTTAVYYRMRFTLLPDGIDLSSPARRDDYGKASVAFTPRGGGPRYTRRGETIDCAFTIPKSSRRRTAARLFADFLLGRYGLVAVRVSGIDPIKGGRAFFSTESGGH